MPSRASKPGPVILPMLSDLRLSHVGQSILGQTFSISGICLQRMELTEQCEVYYRLALALEPDDPRTLVYFGEVLIYLGRRDDGLQMIEKASNLLKDQDDPDKLGERAALLKTQFGS